MYTAQIRIKRDGVQVYQEAKSFARKPAAKAWVLWPWKMVDSTMATTGIGLWSAEVVDCMSGAHPSR